jgi:hypothetical protein
VRVEKATDGGSRSATDCGLLAVEAAPQCSKIGPAARSGRFWLDGTLDGSRNSAARLDDRSSVGKLRPGRGEGALCRYGLDVCTYARDSPAGVVATTRALALTRTAVETQLCTAWQRRRWCRHRRKEAARTTRLPDRGLATGAGKDGASAYRPVVRLRMQPQENRSPKRCVSYPPLARSSKPILLW